MARFNQDILYPTKPDLDGLQVPFTELEIEMAVKQLAKNESLNPVGIPNELIQTQWRIIKKELIAIVRNFYDHTLNLESVNQANMIMIPKKAGICGNGRLCWK